MNDLSAPSLATRAIAITEYGQGRNARPELLLDRRLRIRSSATFLPLLPLSARRLLRHVDRYPGLYLPRIAGVALAALIAYQGSILYGVIVTPLDDRPGQSVRPPLPRQSNLLTSFDPFFTAAVATPVPTPTDLTLHGFRQDRGNGGGSAIISQSDGVQRSFGTGEEIAPGIVLKQVGSDHVVVVRNGLDERLAFKELASPGPAATATMRTDPSPYAPAPATSSAVEGRPRPAAPRGPARPARSVDFADPSTLPASLTSGPALPDRRSTPKR